MINSRLADAVEAYAADGGNAYVAQMWRYALACEGGNGPAPSAQCDAIPYLPVEPDDFGLRLNAKSRILDIGCLGGYGLFDIARTRKQRDNPLPEMMGVDIAPSVVALSRDLADIWHPGGTISFRVSTAEALHPGLLGQFDLVIARLVLPYTDIRAALAAMRSVLSANGLLFLQVHAPRYYLRQALTVWPALDKAFYYMMPVFVYLLFSMCGRQLYLGQHRESALSGRLLSRLGSRHGLYLRKSGGFSAKPWFVYGVQDD